MEIYESLPNFWGSLLSHMFFPRNPKQLSKHSFQGFLSRSLQGFQMLPGFFLAFQIVALWRGAVCQFFLKVCGWQILGQDPAQSPRSCFEELDEAESFYGVRLDYHHDTFDSKLKIRILGCCKPLAWDRKHPNACT